MKVVDLYSLSPTFSLVAAERGHKVLSVLRDDLDNQVEGEPYQIQKKWLHPDVIWTQIPCHTFSVASIGYHWGPNHTPKTPACEFGIKRAKYILDLIKQFKPKYYFIENPQGMLKQMDFMQEYPMRTITYCQYGCSRMKPTNIWTNCEIWKSRPRCHNGDPCHEMSARSARKRGLPPSGTQSLRSKKARAEIPRDLVIEILEAVE